MKFRMVRPMAWAMGLVCSHAAADVTPLAAESEARAARAQASASVSVMENVARRARGVLQKARQSGAPKSIACADETLSLADTTLRTGRERAATVAEAWARGDVPMARTELVRLSSATETARAIGARAEACVDTPHASEGTTVRMIIDPR